MWGFKKALRSTFVEEVGREALKSELKRTEGCGTKPVCIFDL